MKRSEIQLLVANMIRLYRLDNVEDMQAADRLLQVLEQEGMFYCPKPKDGGNFRIPVGWEPEDEEK
jgi:hypothetical protein